MQNSHSHETLELHFIDTDVILTVCISNKMGEQIESGKQSQPRKKLLSMVGL